MASGSPSNGVNINAALSPTLSATSFSSFAELTARSSDEPFEALNELSDEDEILWTGNELDSEEDFVLVPLSKPARLMQDADTVTTEFTHLSLVDPPTPTPGLATVQGPSKPKPKPIPHGRRSARGCSTRSVPPSALSAPKTPRNKRRRGKRDAAASYPSPSPSPVRDERALSPTFEADAGNSGFGERLMVEESDSDESLVRCYDDAVRYITSFLASPTAAISCSAYTRLIFLQSLIIELGLLAPTSALPPSLSAAKRFLKARAFVNIGTYLSVRGQGVESLRAVMFNSRRELAIDLRRRRGAAKADKGWVKRHGLNVLLVSVF